MAVTPRTASSSSPWPVPETLSRAKATRQHSGLSASLTALRRQGKHMRSSDSDSLERYLGRETGRSVCPLARLALQVRCPALSRGSAVNYSPTFRTGLILAFVLGLLDIVF